MDDGLKSQGDYHRKERNWFGKEGEKKPHCIFCKSEHLSAECKTLATTESRKKLFVEKNVCFNYGREGHRGNKCRSPGCFKCGSKHHTSLCDNDAKQGTEPVLNGYSTLDRRRKVSTSHI